MDPRFQDESSGTSADDHPHAGIRAGQYFLNQVYEAVTAGPQWPRTALIINYDEWAASSTTCHRARPRTRGRTWSQLAALAQAAGWPVGS